VSKYRRPGPAFGVPRPLAGLRMPNFGWLVNDVARRNSVNRVTIRSTDRAVSTFSLSETVRSVRRGDDSGTPAPRSRSRRTRRGFTSDDRSEPTRFIRHPGGSIGAPAIVDLPNIGQDQRNSKDSRLPEWWNPEAPATSRAVEGRSAVDILPSRNRSRRRHRTAGWSRELGEKRRRAGDAA